VRAACLRRARGITLAELAVSSFLLAILLSLTHLALVEGIKKQKSLRNDISLQQDALATLTHLSREVSEGHSGTFWPDRTTSSPLTMPSGEPTGFVILSPRDASGRIVLDSSNLPIWQKRVCYYFDNSSNKIYRAEELLASPSSIPPPRDDTKTTQWFKDNVPSDPLPGSAEFFGVVVGETPEQLRFNLTLGSEEGRRKKTLEYVASATLSI
jgi:hypothetical protein